MVSLRANFGRLSSCTAFPRAISWVQLALRERDNIEDDEVDAFKKAATQMLALSDEQIAELIDKGYLTEVEQDEEISQ